MIWYLIVAGVTYAAVLKAVRIVYFYNYWYIQDI